MYLRNSLIPVTAAKTFMPTQLIEAMRKSLGLRNEATDRKSNEKDTEANPSRGGKKQGNKTRSKVRSRVGHVFGAQTMKADNLIVRTIGKARVSTAIGLRSLAYNIV